MLVGVQTGKVTMKILVASPKGLKKNTSPQTSSCTTYENKLLLHSVVFIGVFYYRNRKTKQIEIGIRSGSITVKNITMWLFMTLKQLCERNAKVFQNLF